MISIIGYRKITSGNQSKPVLTLVHGFTHNSDYFSAVLPQFTEHFDTLLIDLRGHGKSGDCSGPFGNFEYTEDVMEVLTKEEIGKTHFWGTHTGTGVGLALAVNHPDLIESMVLEGPVIPDMNMKRTNELVMRVKNKAKSEGIEKALEDWFLNADWFSYMQEHKIETNAQGQKQLISEFAGKPLLCDLLPKPPHKIYENLEKISHPTLIYNGLYDLDEFKQIGDILEQRLKMVTRKVISNAGGFPLWENPKEVIPIVKQFLLKQ